MQIIDRLMVFFRENNLSNYKVEQACGLSNGYLKNLRKAPSVEILEKIFSAYPQLNRDWVMTGNGIMYVETPTREIRDDSETIAALRLTIEKMQKTIDTQEELIASYRVRIAELKGDIATPHRSAATA